MIVKKHGRKLEASVRANLKSAEKLCCVVKAFLDDRAPGMDSFAAMLLVREAVNNAVIHGSRHAPHARVEVAFTVDDDKVVLSVKDQGPGFNWREALEVEPDPLAESGRGLPILQAYASSIQYNEEGNELIVVLRRDKKELP